MIGFPFRFLFSFILSFSLLYSDAVCRFIIYFSVMKVLRVFTGQMYFLQLQNCKIIYLDNFLLHRHFFLLYNLCNRLYIYFWKI